MLTDRIPDAELAAVHEHLVELADNDRDELAGLVGLLVDSLRRTRDGLANAVQAGGRARIVEQAHALRGAASMASLTTIAGCAERIELGRVSTDDIPGEVTRLAALVEQAIVAVRAMC